MNLFPSLRMIIVCSFIIGMGSWLIIAKFDSWLEQAAKYYIHHKTGFSLQISELKTDFSRATVRIKDAAFVNPSHFPNAHFLRINEIKLHIDFFSLFSSKIIIPELVIDVDELCAVCDQQGALNLSEFAKAFRSSSNSKQTPSETPPPFDLNKSPFLIERFFFRLNQITIVDYRESEPVTKSARLVISRVFNNVTNIQQVVLPIAGDLSIFVSDFILDAFLQSTIDTKFSQKLLKVILSPIKDSFDKVKKDSEKLFELFLPQEESSSN